MAQEYLYTTAARVAQRFSQVGIDYRVDHDPDDALDHCIEDASGEVEFYCHRYDPSALDASGWISAKATDIAVYRLCALRGNTVPPSVEKLYLQAIEELTKVQDGKAFIPGIPVGRGAVPTVSTQRVDLRRYPSIRTERPRSTGTADGYKRRIDPTADQIDGG